MCRCAWLSRLLFVVMPTGATPRTVRGYLARTAATSAICVGLRRIPEGVLLAYETVDWTSAEGACPQRRDLRAIRTADDPYSRLLRPIPPLSVIRR